MVRRAGKRQEKTNTRPEVIITTEKVIVEVGAYDELPGEVVNVPGEKVNIFSPFLIWFQQENTNAVVNVTRE